VANRFMLVWAILAGAQLAVAQAQSTPDNPSEPARPSSAQEAVTGSASKRAADRGTAAPEQGSVGASEPLQSVVVSGHFLGSAAQSAMKLDVPVRDTPFAVQSYTDSLSTPLVQVLPGAPRNVELEFTWHPL
jgi:hypothetical protein